MKKQKTSFTLIEMLIVIIIIGILAVGLIPKVTSIA
jgi:prepilin-type N-terminal cleavage/methylation domain-containing protein